MNIFDHLYRNHSKFNTQQDGSRCIYYALTSPELASKVTNIMYKLFFYPLKGDHRGFFFDIQENVLFRGIDEDVTNANTRLLSSKNVKSVTKYIIALQTYLLDHNIFKRLWKLNKITDDDVIESEKIDRDITNGCKHGKNQCKKMKQEYWTIKLHILKRDLLIWCSYQRRRKKKCCTSDLVARITELGITIEPDIEIQKINNHINDIWKELKKLH